MAKLYFRYSAMNAGKSTALLQVAHNYESLGRKVAIFTSEIDHRFKPGYITSRLGLERESQTFDRSVNFFDLLHAQNNIACVLIDEASS